MKTKCIVVYSDTGHAWAKVDKSFLTRLGIADKITHYSFMRGDYAYLEEDCDLTTLVNTLRAKGISPKFKEFSADKSSKIRSYNSYRFIA